jgi:hypothetical protein
MTIVTREMIGAAHDVMLAKGDFVLSANLIERIYLAMQQAAPPPQTPFDTCPTCEALARTVMMDQTGAAMQAAITRGDDFNRPGIAEWSYSMADAMLKERGRVIGKGER